MHNPNWGFPVLCLYTSTICPVMIRCTSLPLQVLKDFEENPRAAQHHLKNTEIFRKINKLVAAGIIQTR